VALALTTLAAASWAPPPGGAARYVVPIVDASPPLAASDNSEPVRLGGDAVRVVLAAPPGQASFASRVRATADEVYLVLQNLQVAASTVVGYKVYLTAEANAAAGKHLVGNFNFFDAESGRRSAAFNISDVVRPLAASGRLGEHPTVTIMPTGSPEAGANPAIGRIVIVAVAS